MDFLPTAFEKAVRGLSNAILLTEAERDRLIIAEIDGDADASDIQTRVAVAYNALQSIITDNKALLLPTDVSFTLVEASREKDDWYAPLMAAKFMLEARPDLFNAEHKVLLEDLAAERSELVPFSFVAKGTKETRNGRETITEVVPNRTPRAKAAYGIMAPR